MTGDQFKKESTSFHSPVGGGIRGSITIMLDVNLEKHGTNRHCGKPIVVRCAEREISAGLAVRRAAGRAAPLRQTNTRSTKIRGPLFLGTLLRDLLANSFCCITFLTRQATMKKSWVEGVTSEKL